MKASIQPLVTPEPFAVAYGANAIIARGTGEQVACIGVAVCAVAVAYAAYSRAVARRAGAAGDLAIAG